MAFIDGKNENPQVMYHATQPKRLVSNQSEADQARKDGFSGYPIQQADKDKPTF